jgi:hypothetical protein
MDRHSIDPLKKDFMSKDLGCFIIEGHVLEEGHHNWR